MDRLREFFETGPRRRSVIGLVAVVVLLSVAVSPIRTRLLQALALSDTSVPEPTASALPSASPTDPGAGRGPILVFPSSSNEFPSPSPSPSGQNRQGGGGRRGYVIAAAGDIACNGGGSGRSECDQAGTAAVLARLKGLDAVLPLGDNQYESGRLSEYQGAYDRTWGRFKGISHPVPGNHDYDSGGEGYFAYFGGQAGNPGAGYYSFDLGGWHLVALNSNCGAIGGCGRGSPQERWLRDDLAHHSKRCTLAYWHHPRFSSGVEHGSTPEMQAIWQALYEHNAEIVLSGHEHNYERFAPQDSVGHADPRKGIREFVVGTGGRNHYGLGRRIANS
ncbi:MAG TPA: metallophosphoesterase, partial [Actinomycetota bacterium]